MGIQDDFRLLVQRYQKPLFSFLTTRLRDRPEAEEAAQESFVRAFMSLKKLRKPESFYSWLLGIAARVAKEQFRTVSASPARTSGGGIHHGQRRPTAGTNIRWRKPWRSCLNPIVR